MTRRLALCPSPPHRGVLCLLRAAMGCDVDRAALIADLKQSDPQDLMRIAVNAYVHVVVHKAFEITPELADGVPADLVIVFNEMRRANLRRNQAIHTQLIEIGRVLSQAGLSGVALKGGAELLAPLHPDPAFRFLSDLDILLPEAELDRAVALLHDLGAVSQEEDEINQRGHHHLEPLWHPDWPVPVELHRGFGSDAAARILPAEDVLRAARATGAPGLNVPAPAHRLAHAVLHAQIDPPRFREGSLSPRDLIEMEVMARQFPETEFVAAKACFEAGGALEAWDALDAARALLLGDRHQDQDRPRAARTWAERALALFGRPRRRRLALLRNLSQYYARAALFDRDRRRHYLRQLLRPGQLRKAIAHQKEKFRRTR